MDIVTQFPRQVREIENLFITLVGRLPPGGAHLAARRCGAEAGARDPGISALSQARRHDGARSSDPPLFRRQWLCLPPGRHARLGRIRRAAARRISEAGAGRLPGGHGLDRGPALVHRQHRHDRHLLGRLQRAAGRRPPSAGAEGGDLPLLDRRPLQRRHPFHGRHAAERQSALGLGHARLYGAHARQGAAGRCLAGDLAEPPEERAAAGGQLAAASAPRRILEAWLGLRGLERHHLPGLSRERLGRRLFQYGPAHARPSDLPQEGAGGSLGA